MLMLLFLLLTSCAPVAHGDDRWESYPPPLEAPIGTQCWANLHRYAIVCDFPKENE